MKSKNNIKFISVALSILVVSCLRAQSRIVINNDAYINIENSAYLVVDNSVTNAITTMGTGGNIVSENETDVIKWNIGNSTGNYIIPWTTLSGVKIPLSINKTTTGTGSGNFILSTYETATDMNTPYPSAVTNMNSSPPVVDESLSVVDRFWHIDARSYTTKPNITMVMNYDPAANELGGTNTLIEANLLAQRFNTSIGSWQSLLFGANDAANDRVTGINIAPADFFEDWILVDEQNPLPIELLYFDAENAGESVKVFWSTATEINNDYFTILRSENGYDFEQIGTEQGAGNSNTVLNYVSYDTHPYSGLSYYQLQQTDFDGTFTFSNIVPVYRNALSIISIYPNPFENSFTVELPENIVYPITVEVIDYLGRQVYEQDLETNTTEIELSNLKAGTYFVKVFNETTQLVERIVKMK